MKKIILTLATVACMTLPMQAQAFDITGIVKNAVTDAVTDVVTETKTEVTKEVTKTAVKETGIVGADKYVDMAVDNADGVKNLGAATEILDADGAAGVIAKANALAVTTNALGDVEPSSGQVSSSEQPATLKDLQSTGTSTSTVQKESPVSGFLKNMFNSK